jgi:putative hydrolase of the HAD superfamily
MIRGVIFDWAGTCATEGEPLISPLLHAKTGLDLAALNEQTVDLYNAFAVGTLTIEQFWQGVRERFHLQHDPEATAEALSRAYLASAQVYPDVLAVATSLRARGVVVALLSNSTALMRDHLKRAVPTANYFDHEVYSCDPDVMDIKPHVKPFEVVLARMSLPAAETLFIDNARSNIEAAKALGMQTLLFTSPEQFLNDLKTQYSQLYV